MTLVAAWKENGVPILIGDLVVSTIGASEAPHFPLPTRSEIDSILPTEWCRRIVSTRQKIYKISDSLAIGWCGAEYSARRIIERFFEEFARSHPTVKDVKEFLANQVGFDKLSCLIIGWVVENDDATLFRWLSESPRSFEIGDLYIEGSGAEHFTEIFAPTIIGRYSDPVRNAICRVANILGHEVLYGTNLWNLFGGGFQLIYLKDGNLEILPSVTFQFIYAVEEGDNLKFGFEKRILKTLYREEIFHTLALIVDQPGEMGKPEMHYTFPVHAKRDFKYSALNNLSLRSEYYAVYFDIICRDDLHANFVVVFPDSNTEPFLKIVPGPNKIERLFLGESLFRFVANCLKNLDRTALKESLQKNQSQ